MKKTLYITIALLLFLCVNSQAQQQFQLTQYQEALTFYNPSFSGIENYTDVRFGFRRQWTGFADAPQTSYVSISGLLPPFSKFKKRKKRKKSKYKSPFDIEKITDMVKTPANALRMSNPTLYKRLLRDSIRKMVRKLDTKGRAKLRKKLRDKNNVQFESKHGISAALLSDQRGAFGSAAFNLGYAYHLPLSQELMLSAGVSATFSGTTFNKDKAQVLNPNDLTYQGYINGDFGKNALFVNTGLTLYSSKFYFSYSVVNMISENLGSEVISLGTATAEMQHNILAGVNIDINPIIKIVPGFLLIAKTKSPSVFNLNAKVYYQEKYWFGLNYRNKDAVGASLGMLFNDRYKFSYSYDNPTSTLKGSSGGTHEIVFGILLSKGASPNPIIR